MSAHESPNGVVGRLEVKLTTLDLRERYPAVSVGSRRSASGSIERHPN